MSELGLSQRMMDVVFSAVEEGITTLKAGQTLVPFVLMLTKEGVILRRFSDEKIADALKRAETAIYTANDDSLGYVMVYDSQIEVNGKDTDALMLEVGERANDTGWRFVQRYQTAVGTNPLYTIGELAYIGNAKNHFTI